MARSKSATKRAHHVGGTFIVLGVHAATAVEISPARPSLIGAFWRVVPLEMLPSDKKQSARYGLLETLP